MGGTLAQWVVINCTDDRLSNSALRTLIFVALHARDTPTKEIPAHEYFRGRDFAREILYSGLSKSAGERHLDRAVAECINAGFLERLSPAAGRRPGVLRIHPNGTYGAGG